MIPNLDFIKTALNGIVAFVEKAIKSVEAKIVTPDFEAEEGEAGHIKNKPTLVGEPGTGEGSAVFGDTSVNSASGSFSHVEGGHFQSGHSGSGASGWCAHAEGCSTNALGDGSHSEGGGSRAEGTYAHAEGYSAKAIGENSHAEGRNTEAHGAYSHAEGCDSEAHGAYSHAEGYYTFAYGGSQHVQGKYNIRDEDGKYAHIVGNGKPAAPSNAHTIDWEGNAWFAGTVEGTALILKSPSGKRFKIAVDDSGTLSATEITT